MTPSEFAIELGRRLFGAVPEHFHFTYDARGKVAMVTLARMGMQDGRVMRIVNDVKESDAPRLFQEFNARGN